MSKCSRLRSDHTLARRWFMCGSARACGCNSLVLLDYPQIATARHSEYIDSLAQRHNDAVKNFSAVGIFISRPCLRLHTPESSVRLLRVTSNE